MTVSELGPLVTPHHCLRSASFKPIGPQLGDTGRCKQTAMVSIEFVPQLAAFSVHGKTLKRHTQSPCMLDVLADEIKYMQEQRRDNQICRSDRICESSYIMRLYKK